MRVSDRERALAEERHRDASLTAPLERQRSAGDERDEIAEHRDEREDASLGRAEMHVAVPAERRARRLAEEVAEDVCGRRAAREVAGELPVEGGDDVVGAEREPGACGDCLLAATRVDGAWHAPLPVERHHAILEQALQEDEPEERDALVERRPRALRHRARSASVGEQLVEGGDRAVDRGHVRVLELGSERHRRVRRGVKRGRCVEMLEGASGDAAT